MQCFYNFSCLCIKIFKARKFKASQNNLLHFFSFIVQSHSFNSRQVHRQIIICADYLKVIIFQEKQFVQDGSFTNFWFVGSKN